MKKVDTNALIADLNRIPWSILDTCSNDPDEILDTWIKLVLDVVDTHAPMKKNGVKSPDKPSWLMNETGRKRSNIVVTSKKLLDHGKIPRAAFNKARTKVVHVGNKAKSVAIENELEEKKQSSRLLWKALKNVEKVPVVK